MLQKLRLKELLELYLEKYQNQTTFHIFRSLLYFNNADQDPEPIAINSNITWEKVKKHIIKEVKNFCKMPQHTVNLQKMPVELLTVATYSLLTDRGSISMNEMVGKTLKISFSGEIYCIGCGARIKKTYGQGYCYPCFDSSPENEECVLRPELCRAHEGIARDMDYAMEHCLQPHFVYLAVSSDIKVGVTRSSQIPTRWIDQGAGMAVKIACTPNRYTAGLIEVALKNYFPDKTNWRLMLTTDYNKDLSLKEAVERAKNNMPEELLQYFLIDQQPTTINYPLKGYPKKVVSVDIEKMETVEGYLLGIKGQYLIFDNGNVMNVRKHNGYKVVVSYE